MTNQKLTRKQEAFAQAYVETGNASEAYRRAYNAGSMKPEGIHVNASKLLANTKVSLRVDELRAAAAKRHEVTLDSLVQELEEARTLAIKTETPSAAVAATMGKGKLLGLIVDRSEHSGKDGTPLVPEPSNRELTRIIFGLLSSTRIEQPNDGIEVEDDMEPTRTRRFPGWGSAQDHARIESTPGRADSDSDAGTVGTSVDLPVEAAAGEEVPRQHYSRRGRWPGHRRGRVS